MLDATRKRVFLLHDVHRPAPCLLHSRWALSYLRGPLTREEISRLMANRPHASADVSRSATDSAPPPLPAPFRRHFLARLTGTHAEPHVLVKYAVRYKGLGETVAVRATADDGPICRGGARGGAVRRR